MNVIELQQTIAEGQSPVFRNTLLAKILVGAKASNLRGESP